MGAELVEAQVLVTHLFCVEETVTSCLDSSTYVKLERPATGVVVSQTLKSRCVCERNPDAVEIHSVLH
jgi:hypothetical protein